MSEERSKTRNIYQGCYGTGAKPSKVKSWVLKSVRDNIKCEERGLAKSTLSIWGAPGTSKTSIVKQLTSEQIEMDGKMQNIEVIDIPLAQIEEMGDVLGFPVEEVEVTKDKKESKWIKAADSIIKSHLEAGWTLTDRKRTSYAPPLWVPSEERPGVLLFDDGNRASQRIMKGLMQLVQDYRTISWKIPRGWTICFTGNPDNKYNQVSSMDGAQITRMKHITLECDSKEWASWAVNNGVDERGVNFVLRYPEMMMGKERTNPRTLTAFFQGTHEYTDLSNKEQLEDFLIDANASLDEETVSTIINFMTRENELVISPEMILEEPEKSIEKALDLMKEKKNSKGEMVRQARVDIIAVTMSRLALHLCSQEYKFKDHHPASFEKWILNDKLPKDLIYATLSDIVESKFPYSKKFIKGDNITNLIMDIYRIK